jgi:hypothetical protein
MRRTSIVVRAIRLASLPLILYPFILGAGDRFGGPNPFATQERNAVEIDLQREPVFQPMPKCR